MNRIGQIGVCVMLAAGVVSAQTGTRPPAGARAELKDAKGQSVGEVTLRETPHGVLLAVELRGVEPGVKAFHIHDVGRCEPPAFQSAGPHFNPAKAPHGLMTPNGPHAGDLPNIHVPETGMASVEVLAPGTTVASLLDANGAAVVLHAKADDYASDPAGNAGDRVACGVVAK